MEVGWGTWLAWTLRGHRFSRGPMWRRKSKPLEMKLKPKNFEFGAFIDPSDQNQQYHTPLLSKIWDLSDRKSCEQSLLAQFRLQVPSVWLFLSDYLQRLKTKCYHLCSKSKAEFVGWILILEVWSKLILLGVKMHQFCNNYTQPAECIEMNKRHTMRMWSSFCFKPFRGGGYCQGSD